MPIPAGTLRSHIDHDGAVIFDIKQSTVTRLNATGARIWAAIQDGDSPESIVRALSEETGEDLGAVHADVHHFIDQLRFNGLFVD